jgi:hypothetical protein
VNFGQALGNIVTMQEAGALPRASIIVKSGRGMWLIYMLHDPKDPTRAPGAFPEKLDQYFALQRAIVARLAPLGADPCARDAARHVRVPGSLHTGSERYVQWWIQGEGASAYSYSLSQLSALFGVVTPIRHPRERAVFDRTDKEKKRRGWVALNARRLREFNVLRTMRGGFYQGCRNNAAMIYAWLLRCNGVPRHEALVLVNLLGAECHPHLTPSECKKAVRTGFGPRMCRMLDQTIADRLDVALAEIEMLEDLPCATRFKPAEARIVRAGGRSQNILGRRSAITAIIAEAGSVLPVREMSRRLAAAGFCGNRQTVFKDYRALGIEWERTRAARAEKRERQLSLPVA